MKKILPILTLLILSLPLFAEEKTERIEKTGPFTAIQLMDSINVVYHNEPEFNGTVRWTDDENTDDSMLIIRNNKGTLKIQLDITPENEAPACPTIHVYSDFLSKVLNYSDGQILVEQPAACAKIEFSQIGNGSIVASGLNATEIYAKVTAGMGTISLAGKCGTATYRMTGTGTIQADELAADTVNCRIFGGGNIGCDPHEKLNVTGIGSTRIYYKGNPQISHKGGGKLLPVK